MKEEIETRSLGGSLININDHKGRQGDVCTTQLKKRM